MSKPRTKRTQKRTSLAQRKIDEEDKRKKKEIIQRKQKIDDMINGKGFEIVKDFDMSKFNFQNQKCMLTYSTHIDKKKYLLWINEKNPGMKNIHMAHETGDTRNNYDHTHIIIDFGKRFQTRNCGYFDYSGIHPHIARILTPKHWNNCLLYLAKEDLENAYLLDVYGDRSLVEKIWECETEEEALIKYVNSPNDYDSVKKIYRDREGNDKNLVRFEINQLFPWEKAFLKICSQDNYKDRTINWVYDERGNSGKTQWSYHMEDNYDRGWFIIDNLGRVGDFVHNVKKYSDTNMWGCKGVILDLPRSYKADNVLYTCLELLVNGRMTATKYDGGKCNLGKAKIWIFANFKPLVNLMSLDRWRVLHVARSGKCVRLMNYNSDGRFTNFTKITHGFIGHSYTPPVVAEGCSSGSMSVDLDISFDEEIYK